MRLNNIQLAAWLTALRSGKFKQGKCDLYNPKTDCYCALGVLGVVFDIPKEHLARASESYLDVFNPYELDCSHEIWQLNDLEDKSFAQIANWLEAHRDRVV